MKFVEIGFLKSLLASQCCFLLCNDVKNQTKVTSEFCDTSSLLPLRVFCNVSGLFALQQSEITFHYFSSFGVQKKESSCQQSLPPQRYATDSNLKYSADSVVIASSESVLKCENNSQAWEQLVFKEVKQQQYKMPLGVIVSFQTWTVYLNAEKLQNKEPGPENSHWLPKKPFLGSKSCYFYEITDTCIVSHMPLERTVFSHVTRCLRLLNGVK